MTPPQTPTYEQREKTYEEPELKYRVQLPGIEAFTVTDREKAEAYARNGATVKGVKGWEDD